MMVAAPCRPAYLCRITLSVMQSWPYSVTLMGSMRDGLNEGLGTL